MGCTVFIFRFAQLYCFADCDANKTLTLKAVTKTTECRRDFTTIFSHLKKPALILPIFTVKLYSPIHHVYMYIHKPSQHAVFNQRCSHVPRYFQAALYNRRDVTGDVCRRHWKRWRHRNMTSTDDAIDNMRLNVTSRLSCLPALSPTGHLYGGVMSRDVCCSAGARSQSNMYCSRWHSRQNSSRCLPSDGIWRELSTVYCDSTRLPMY